MGNEASKPGESQSQNGESEPVVEIEGTKTGRKFKSVYVLGEEVSEDCNSDGAVIECQQFRAAIANEREKCKN